MELPKGPSVTGPSNSSTNNSNSRCFKTWASLFIGTDLTVGAVLVLFIKFKDNIMKQVLIDD